MRPLFCLAGFFLLLLSCNSKPEPPPDVIPREKLQAIMIDFQLAEAAIQTRMARQQSQFLSQYYYQMLLEKHGVSREQLIRSLHYYQNHMQDMDSIYSVVIDSLGKMQSKEKEE